MKEERNVVSWTEYIFYHIEWAVLFCIIYYVWLFVGIPGLSVNVSKVIYFLGIQACWMVLSLITTARQRTKLSAFFNVILSYAAYFFITYSMVYEKFIRIFTIIAVVLSLAYFSIVVFKRIKNKSKFKRIVKSRVKFALQGTRTIAGFLFCIMLSVACFSSAFGIKLVQTDVPSLESANVESAEEWTIKNNIETVKLLQEDSWQQLTFDEKMHVLGVIRNIEIRYLGIPHEVYIAADVTEEDVLGYYDHIEHTIVLNSDMVKTGDAKENLSTLCHEIYHSYEYNQVEVYQSVDEKHKNLRMFSGAREYEKEFEDYISAEEDVFGYLLQDSEINADVYAEDAVEDYYRQIEVYLNEAKQVNAA